MGADLLKSSSSTLDFSALRAIPFVGSWSQLKQNVPGFYGLGSALKTYEDSGELNGNVHNFTMNLISLKLITRK